jgi:outer membrane protein OmpA-like peptidoglycan-associated protein
MRSLSKPTFTGTAAAIALAVTALGVSRPAAADACSTVFKEVTAAKATLDVERAARAFDRVENTDPCPGPDMARLGRAVSLIFYHRAYAHTVDPSEQERLVSRGLEYGRPWRLVAWAGDIAMDSDDHAEAARLYQAALDDIRDAERNSTPPDKKIIAAIHKKAQEASLLSTEYVKRTDRSGEPTGLACPTFRGYEPRRTAVPVQFEYDSVEFTVKGRKALEDMRIYLRRQGDPDIRLIGHTDPRGTEAYNQVLSERRANAVQAALKRRGYEGVIRTSGRGETERFVPDDPGRYDKDQQYQLDRRVELEREKGVPYSIASR